MDATPQPVELNSRKEPKPNKAYGQLTRRVEFDAAHQLPNQAGPCRNVHGHRYVVDVTLWGAHLGDDGSPTEGMVVDLGLLKTLVRDVVVNVCDHAFLAAGDEPALLAAADTQRGLNAEAGETMDSFLADPLHRAGECEYAARRGGFGRVAYVGVRTTAENLARYWAHALGLYFRRNAPAHVAADMWGLTVRVQESPNGWAEYAVSEAVLDVTDYSALRHTTAFKRFQLAPDVAGVEAEDGAPA